MARDYIPRNAEKFSFFMKRLIDYVKKMAPEWPGIPVIRINQLDAVYGVFASALETAMESPTPGNINARKLAQARAVKVLREFVNQFLRFSPVNNTDRIEMGIPNHDTVRTPSPVPTTVPEIETDTSVIRELSMRMRDFGAASWGKPAHVRSMELAWGIREDRPAVVSEFPNMEAATANPIVLSFEEEERGKRVFFAARWLNNTAQPGPWSDIESAVVP